MKCKVKLGRDFIRIHDEMECHLYRIDRAQQYSNSVMDGPSAVHSDNVKYELHDFADASSATYAAIVYLKIILEAGDITVSLLAGNSKIAPLCILSIPRLELLAAVLLIRLITFVRIASKYQTRIARQIQQLF